MSKIFKNVKKFIPFYVMLLPGCFYLVLNNYLPLYGIIIAFKKFNYSKGIWRSDWSGLQNFEYLFKTKDAFVITRNTVCYNLVFIVLGTICAIALSIMLNEIRSKFSKKIYQTLILIPYLISTVIVSYIVYGFLSTDYGMLNHFIISVLGGEKISWYSKAVYWPFILVLVYLWKSMGYNTVLYYATIIGIDPTYYEAAAIDGATRWQRIRHIILPNLQPTIIILTLMSISRIFYSDFGLFYQVPLNNGQLISVTNTIDTYVYRGLMESNNLGMSAAAAFYQSIVGFILVITANFIVKRFDKDSALF